MTVHAVSAPAANRATSLGHSSHIQLPLVNSTVAAPGNDEDGRKDDIALLRDDI